MEGSYKIQLHGFVFRHPKGGKASNTQAGGQRARERERARRAMDGSRSSGDLQSILDAISSSDVSATLYIASHFGVSFFWFSKDEFELNSILLAMFRLRLCFDCLLRVTNCGWIRKNLSISRIIRIVAMFSSFFWTNSFSILSNIVEFPPLEFGEREILPSSGWL